ncbi:hypothetical protein L6452_12334 [Arctium lappa]|uniref:Uncharacterized protein n=1 Tax=Arctium lappa TaxID=4217 RepID=A0ACB9DQD4_ARCLA|nr:hypothetical protein L6452_12334 [Arctium lappa]
MSSANSPPELPEEPVPQPMLCALVNHNQRLLEENHARKTRLEVYAKKAKLENERMISRQCKVGYEDTSRKLWEKSLAMNILLSKIKTVKGRCRCLAFRLVDGI